MNSRPAILCTTALALALLVSACSPTRVTVDRRPDVDLRASRDFMFRERPELRQELPTLFSQLNEERIEAAIARELTAFGWSMADTDADADADVAVVVHLASRQEIRSVPGSHVGVGFGFGYHSHAGVGFGHHDVETVDYLRLVVDLRSVADDQLLWQGVGSRRLPADGLDAAVIDEMVARIFSQSPFGSG